MALCLLFCSRLPVLNARQKLSLAIMAASFALVFGPILVRLAADWKNDDNYSHGFLIIPLALYVVWDRRERLRKTAVKPAAFGIAIVLGSLAMLVAGRLGAEMFLTRAALIGTLAGGVLFIWGWARLRVLTFPLSLLLLMIPVPAILFNQIAFPLQLWASGFGELALSAARIPVLREGNVIVLANTSLEVAEACSGIRSLISLLTLGIVLGYFTEQRSTVRTALALSTIPVAIIANGTRVAATGIAAHYYGPAAAQGVFHTFSGWLVFVFSFVFLLAIQRALVLLLPKPAVAAPVAGPSPSLSL